MDFRPQEPPRTEGIIRWLRWAGVLPAAVLASVAIGFIAGVCYSKVAPALGEPGRTRIVHYLLLVLLYVPKEVGAVIAGAKAAPQGRTATAIVLAALGILFSLATHVLSQAHRGTTNSVHLALESTGAILGAVYVVTREKPRAIESSPRPTSRDR